MGRILTLADPHGGRRAIDQVMDRANYDPASDTIIVLGDVCDGWPEVAESIEFFLGVPEDKLIALRGNHDEWTEEWMRDFVADPHWLSQGGMATFESLGPDPVVAKQKWGAYFRLLRNYYYDSERDFLFVHAGIDPSRELSEQKAEVLLWDRTLFFTAANLYRKKWVMRQHSGGQRPGRDGRLTSFTKVFLGHSTTTSFSDTPVEESGVVMMDTGAGWEGKLSLMDIDSGEVWQSDVVGDLYPEARGRRG